MRRVGPGPVVYVSSAADMLGGGEHSLLDLAAGMARETDVRLILPAAGELKRRAGAAGLDVAQLPMPPVGPASIAALLRWIAAMRARPPRLLHANSSRAALYAGLAGRLLGIPVIFHCRVAAPDARLDPLLVRLVDAVIANSRATAARFARWPELPVRVVYNGVAIPPGAGKGVRPQGARALLLSVARLSRWKRHDLLLDLFAALADRFPGLHLACVGDDDPGDPSWGEALRRRSAQAGWGSRVHWPGRRDDLGEWYGAADLFVHSAKDEPFGRVFVEAMGRGVPVVAFDGGGAPEVVESGRQGLLVPDGDVEAMAEAVAFLLDDGARRARMGRAGRLRAERFSIDRHVEAVRGVYREVTGAR